MYCIFAVHAADSRLRARMYCIFAVHGLSAGGQGARITAVLAGRCGFTPLSPAACPSRTARSATAAGSRG
jgi:hypothetical protein